MIDADVATLQVLVGGLLDAIERQQQVLRALLAMQRRLAERVDLELTYQQPSPMAATDRTDAA